MTAPPAKLSQDLQVVICLTSLFVERLNYRPNFLFLIAERDWLRRKRVFEVIETPWGPAALKNVRKTHQRLECIFIDCELILTSGFNFLFSFTACLIKLYYRMINSSGESPQKMLNFRILLSVTILFLWSNLLAT